MFALYKLKERRVQACWHVIYSDPKVKVTHSKVTHIDHANLPLPANVIYIYPNVTYSGPKVTYSDPRMTYTYPNVGKGCLILCLSFTIEW